MINVPDTFEPDAYFKRLRDNNMIADPILRDERNRVEAMMLKLEESQAILAEESDPECR